MNIGFDREVELAGLWEDRPLLEEFEIGFSDHLVGLQQTQDDYTHEVRVTYPNAIRRQSAYLAFEADGRVLTRHGEAATAYSLSKAVYG